MTSYSIEQSIKKYVKGYGFLSFGKNLSNKYGKKLLDAAAKKRKKKKTGLDALKTASKKVAHKAAETTSKLLGNKIADKTIKSKPVPDAYARNIEETIIPPQKREEILDELRRVL